VSVRVATTDWFPHACVEYVCVCGATAHAHGKDAGTLPAEWVRIDAAGEADEIEHLCPRCASAASGRAPAK
jgi:hypothetical protein